MNPLYRRVPTVFAALMASFLFPILASSAGSVGEEDVVGSDAGVYLTGTELKYLIANEQPIVQKGVRSNEADRFEVVASVLRDKKIKSALEGLDPVASADVYHRYLAAMRKAAKEFDALRFQVELEIPDLEKLARERYRVSKNEIAVVAEQRMASHILLLCTEECDRELKQAELQEIRERLLAGESFGDLATEYSQDPGSRQRAGRLSQPITLKDQRIDKTFRDTAFALEETGQISDIVESRFGFHIIRLDEIIPERLYTFEEIKAPLIEEVEKRYRADAYREYLRTFGPSEDFMIDYEAIDAVLGPVTQAEQP